MACWSEAALTKGVFVTEGHLFVVAVGLPTTQTLLFRCSGIMKDIRYLLRTQKIENNRNITRD